MSVATAGWLVAASMAAVVASVALGVARGAADRHADADAFADGVVFAVRNLLAHGAGDLLDHFLTFIAAGRDGLLLDDFLGNHLADLHLADFFAGLPHLDGVGAAGNRFLNSCVFREQSANPVSEALVSAGIVASVAAAGVFMTAATSRLGTMVFADADAFANGLAGLGALFADPFAAANLDFLLFPDRFANDSLALDLFGLVNGLADHFTNFLHHRFGDGFVAGALTGFRHGLPLVFVTYLGGTTGVRSRAASHDGGSATAAATVSHRCGIGTEDSCDSCNGRGKELQAHLSALLCGETNRRTGHPGRGLTSATADTPTCSRQSCALDNTRQKKEIGKDGDSSGTR